MAECTATEKATLTAPPPQPAGPITIRYGTHEKTVDATAALVKCSKVPHLFVFSDPGTDLQRRDVICPRKDPARGVVKKLFLYASTDTHHEAPLLILDQIRVNYGVHFSTADELVYILRRFHSSPSRLSKIHERFARVGFSGNYMDEYHEQLLAVTFVPATAKVLELGANVGRNTCVIGTLLSDPSRLVTFETIHFEACVTKINLAKCGLHSVNVETAALSSMRLEQSQWLTRPIPPRQRVASKGWTEVKTMSYETVLAKYGTFDTLVADCEGALLFILRDSPQLLDTVRLIIVENDYKDLAHYEEVATRFIERGFSKIMYMTNADANFPTKSYFYEAWQRS